MIRTYAIVTGDFTPWGGMDRPNYELAWYLADQKGARVHLVSHRVAEPLASHPNVAWHRVARPLGKHSLGAPLLDRRGRQVAREVARAGGTVVVNGGNCVWGDVNWIHFVHNVPSLGGAEGSWLRRSWKRWNRVRDQRRERQAVSQARLVITDSDLVKRCLLENIPIRPDCIRTIYYGVDPHQFRPPTPAERLAARRSLGLPEDRPLVAFVGALGHDRRKGFDVLFDAWCQCRAEPGWNAVLVVAGTGSELPDWQRRGREAGLEDVVRMLGFTRSVPTLLAAADALVSPTRLEPYGQGVHEAICCGLPAFVTRCAGIAERYPADLHHLLLDDPPNPTQLAARLRQWHQDIDGHRHRLMSFSQELRSRNWSDMASDFVCLLESKTFGPERE